MLDAQAGTVIEIDRQVLSHRCFSDAQAGTVIEIDRQVLSHRCFQMHRQVLYTITESLLRYRHLLRHFLASCVLSDNGGFSRKLLAFDYRSSKFVILRSINSVYFKYSCHHVSRCGLLIFITMHDL